MINIKTFIDVAYNENSNILKTLTHVIEEKEKWLQARVKNLQSIEKKKKQMFTEDGKILREDEILK